MHKLCRGHGCDSERRRELRWLPRRHLCRRCGGCNLHRLCGGVVRGGKSSGLHKLRRWGLLVDSGHGDLHGLRRGNQAAHDGRIEFGDLRRLPRGSVFRRRCNGLHELRLRFLRCVFRRC